MKRTNSYLDEKGVSETIGFIIILGIVITGIGLVTLYGYPALLSQQDEANSRNMEKSMIVLQSDLNSLAFKNIPYYEEALQVSGGVLSIKNPSHTPSFQISTASDGDLPLFQLGEIHFEPDSGGAVIALSNGAVVKRYNGQTGSSMISSPRWFLDKDPDTGDITLIISLIRVHSTVEYATSGISTIRMQRTPGTTLRTINDPGEITIKYITGATDENIYPTAWSNFASREDLNMDVDPGIGNEYKFIYPNGIVDTINIDGTIKTLIVREYDIEILGL